MSTSKVHNLCNRPKSVSHDKPPSCQVKQDWTSMGLSHMTSTPLCRYAQLNLSDFLRLWGLQRNIKKLTFMSDSCDFMPELPCKEPLRPWAFDRLGPGAVQSDQIPNTKPLHNWKAHEKIWTVWKHIWKHLMWKNTHIRIIRIHCRIVYELSLSYVSFFLKLNCVTANPLSHRQTQGRNILARRFCAAAMSNLARQFRDVSIKFIMKMRQRE